MTAATGDRDLTSHAIGDPEAERAANRRERLAGILQRSGAFVVLIIVTLLASLVFGARFASIDNFLNIPLQSFTVSSYVSGRGGALGRSTY